MKLKYNFIANKVAGETVLVAVGEGSIALGGFLKTDDIGSLILETLKNDVTFEEIVSSVKKEYCGDDLIIRERIEQFIEKIKALDLLI